MGSSGGLFGVLGFNFVSLIINWKIIKRPEMHLVSMVSTVLLSFAIGLVPQVDNLSHMGGFFMGLLNGLAFLPRMGMTATEKHGSATESPVRRPLTKRVPWRMILGLVLIFAVFGGLVYAFQHDVARNWCPWCKYLDCLPGIFDCGN
jgi:uncharacterized membrane-anchored protein YitT (DUF2179 family)